CDTFLPLVLGIDLSIRHYHGRWFTRGADRVLRDHGSKDRKSVGGGDMATPEAPTAGATSQKGAAEIRIYQHSPIIYWWVVWAYGFFCALLTYAQGDRVAIGGTAKAVLMHPSPWL